MVSLKSVEKQFKRIKFNHHTWNHAEAMELPDILLPDEEIFECVNGMYEGGFALLVATDVRLLLVDKKPFKFLNVEDLRFDMINEIDYSHRLFGAHISISAGSKNLKFTSYNQQRLRKCIGHVQHCMAESKKNQSKQADNQQQHLEQINQQLQAYLLAQHQQQEELRKQLNGENTKIPDPIRPDPQLADFLFAQSLLAQQQQQLGAPPSSTNTANQFPETQYPKEPARVVEPAPMPIASSSDWPTPRTTAEATAPNSQLVDLYQEGMQEIFGKRKAAGSVVPPAAAQTDDDSGAATTLQDSAQQTPTATNPLEINPLRVAYSKLPMVLRNRAFGRRVSALHPSMPAAPSITPASVSPSPQQ